MASTDLERLVVQLSADIKRFENSMARANGVAQREMGKISSQADKLDKRLSTVGIGFGSHLATVLSGAAAIEGFKGLTKAADEWITMQNKLNSSADFAGVQTRSLGDLKDGANDARTEISSYVDLYSKLIASASKVAGSEREIATATNLVSKAFKAGGASTQDQINGITQLGQALGSGVLQGDELRSLRESSPVIVKAIAAEFETTVAGLKKLGAEGKLTSERVFKAILAFEKPIESAFSKTRSTIGDAMTQINNEFLEYIGNADASAGASAKLVEALNFLAANFKETADVVVQLVAVLTGALVGRAIAGVIVGFGNAVVAIGAFITAARTGTLVAGSLTAALGPIGIIAGAAAAAYLLMGDNVSAAEKASIAAEGAFADNAISLDAAKEASVGYTNALRNQIAMQLAVASAAAKAASDDADAAVDRALAFRTTARSITGLDLRFDPFEYAADQADKNAFRVGMAAAALEKQLAEVDANLIDPDKGFGGGVTTPTDSGGSKAKKTDADRFKEDLTDARARIDMLKEETAIQAGLNPLVNDYGEAVTKLRMQQDLLNSAKENGITITPKLKETIDAISQSYADASVSAAKLSESQDRIRQNAEEMIGLGKDVTRGFVDGFIQGKSAAEMFADALSKIGNKLLDLAFDSAFSTEGGGGFLANLFKAGAGSLAGGSTSAAADPWSGMRSAAPAAAAAVPSISRMASPKASAGASFSFAPVIDARGADAAAVARIDANLKKMNSEFEARVIKTNRTARNSNVK